MPARSHTKLARRNGTRRRVRTIYRGETDASFILDMPKIRGRWGRTLADIGWTA